MGIRTSWKLRAATEYPERRGPYLDNHFEKEQLLLEWEWLAPKRFARIQEARPHYGGMEGLVAAGLYEHVFRRFEEIDAAAPRPDFDAMGREIERLEQKWREQQPQHEP